MSQSDYCLDCKGKCHHLGHIEGIPGVRVTSPSRIFTGNVVGKALTDRKITEYQRAGKYGGTIVLPVATGPRCTGCQGTKGVRRINYSYMPKAGHWCVHCRDRYKKEREQEKKLAALVKERRRSYE